ncbi:hypothetical protein Bca52824_093568 [Brassica carinata]|uniref:Uncharacterized protein n=1 Tax=Brassica carinata TaxID=52824 RepID=A0A8X7P3T5_BRACI|nr:hypothetical protein Bca52824_093568 [Brassica carinata]
MPLVRFKIRNELSLGGPELNRSPAVEYEEPKAILGAVEVAGLVGILRQLGDLAEFSAEVFNGIQEEVTVTASRCQKLTSRVKRIESALSPLEKAVLSQTSHIHFAYTAGCEWHPRIRNGQRHFVQSDLPLCVMETYEQCRDPPPLHLLDRFDAGGPGSCLRKYSDPTFFRKELGNHTKDDIKAQKDQTHRKRKKKRLPQRNICRSRAVSTSDDTNGARLSSLTDDIPTTSQSTSTVDMPRTSNMQDLSGSIDQSHLQEQSNSQEQSEEQVQSDLQESSRPRDSITGSGYIEYVINHSPVNKPDVKLLEGSLPSSLQPADRIGSAVPQGRVEVVDDNILCSPSKEIHVPYASIVCDEKKEALESRAEKGNKDEEASEIHEPKIGPGTPDRVKQNQRDFDRTYDFFDEVCIVGEKQSKSQANSIDEKPRIESEEENTSEQGSEADEFVDARNTIESESESELDGIPKPKLEHYFGDISTYCSDDASSDNNGGSEDIPFEEMVEGPRHDNSLDESCSVSYLPDDASVSCCQSDSLSGKVLSHDETFQNPREFSAMRPSLLAEAAFRMKLFCENLLPHIPDAIPAEKILPEEHLANHPSLAEAVPHEKSLPGESVAKYPSFAEIVPSERILPKTLFPKLVFGRSCCEWHPRIRNGQRHFVQSDLPLCVMETYEQCRDPPPLHLLDRFDAGGPGSCLRKYSDPTFFRKELGNHTKDDIKAQKDQTHRKRKKKRLPQRNICRSRAVSTSDDTNGARLSSLTDDIPTTSQSTSTVDMPRTSNMQDLSGSIDQSHLQEQSNSQEQSEEQVQSDLQESSRPRDSITGSGYIEYVINHSPVNKPDVKLLEGSLPSSLQPADRIGSAVPQGRVEVVDDNILCSPSKEIHVPYASIVCDEKKEALESRAEKGNKDEEASEIHEPKIGPGTPDRVKQNQRDFDRTYDFSTSQANSIDEKPRIESEEENTSEQGSEADEFVDARNTIESESESELDGIPKPKLEHYFGDISTYCSDDASSDNNGGSEDIPFEEMVEGPRHDNSLDESCSVSYLPDDASVSCCQSDSLSGKVLSHDETFQNPREFSAMRPSLLAEAAFRMKLFCENLLPHIPGWQEIVPMKRPCQKSLWKHILLWQNCLKRFLLKKLMMPHIHSKSVIDEKISPEVSCLSLEEALPQELISLEEFVGIDPCLAESVPDERLLPVEAVLTEESVTTDMSLTKPEPIQELLPEESLEAYVSLEKSPKDEISQEKSDDDTRPSCDEAETVPNVSSFPDKQGVAHQSSAEAVSDEEISVSEAPGYTTEAGPHYTEESVATEPIVKILPEGPLDMYPSLEELPEEKISQEVQPNDGRPPCFSEAVGDEKISLLEQPCSTYPSLEESVPHEKTSAEEIDGTNPFLELAVPNVSSFPDKQGVAHQSSAEAVSREKNLPEESLLAYFSLAEHVFDEKASGSEAGPHYTEESVATEAVPEEKISLEETDTTCPPSAEAVSDEEISGSESRGDTTEAEAPASTTETDPHGKNFPEEPVATYPSLEEPVPDDNVLPKEPAPAFLDLSEGIPDQQVFLDDAAFLSFAEAIFDQKFSPEVPDSMDLPAKNTLEKEVETSDGTIVEPVNIWSNGGLLGLAPSKPPVFAEPKSVSEHIRNEINEASVIATRKQGSSSRPVEDTEKCSLPLVVSDHTSQQQSNMLSHSNGSLSPLQSTATSFKVFGLSHRLLMAGFRGNSSATYKFESIPTSSYDTKAAAIEDKTQQTPLHGPSFEEQLAYESSIFGSPTSSPPVEHMKISFSSIDPSPVSKLKLRIPCQPQYNGENVDTFPSFQLVPEASNSDNDDDNSDIFCQSSPCVSDNCLSDSELWESDEDPRESASSLKEVGERRTHGDMGSFPGSFLDLPCYDSVDHHSTSPRLEQEQEKEREQVPEYKPSVSEIIRHWPPNQ